MGGGEWGKPAAFYVSSTVKTGTYPLLRRPVALNTRAAPGSNSAPVLPPSLEQKSVFRPFSCMRIPLSLQVHLLHPYLKRQSWLFLWSGRRDEFSDAQKRKIHSVSELRKIPMHGGGSDLAAGLNHVMRGPRGSESLYEKIDFTPEGGKKKESKPRGKTRSQ